MSVKYSVKSYRLLLLQALDVLIYVCEIPECIIMDRIEFHKL